MDNRPIITTIEAVLGNNTKKGDVMRDPFGGSVSTLIAREPPGGSARLRERDPRSGEVIVGRGETLTGRAARRATAAKSRPDAIPSDPRGALPQTTQRRRGAARDRGRERGGQGDGRRWLHQPGFLHAVRDAEARAADERSRLLVRRSRTAAATLARAMSDPSVPPATWVRSADIAPNRFLQVRELARVEARFTELERLANLEAER